MEVLRREDIQHPVRLTFSDPHLETRYQKYRCLSVLYHLDKAVFCIHAFTCSCYLLLVLLNPLKYQRPLHWTLHLYVFNLVWQGFALFWLSRGVYTKWRDWISGSARAVASVTAALGTVPFWVPDLRVNGFGSFIALTSLGTGSVNQAYESLGKPLSFNTHLWFQALTTAAHVIVLRQRFCSCALNLAQCPAIKSHPVLPATQQNTLLLKYLARGWHLANRISAITIYLGDHSALMHSVKSRVQSSDYELCTAVVLLWQLVFAYLAPTVILYVMEQRSRSWFLSHLEKHAGHLELEAFQEQWSRYQFIWHMVDKTVRAVSLICVVVVAVFMSWELLMAAFG